MKRFFPILLISAFTAVFLLFTGCGSQGEENEVSIKDRMDQKRGTYLASVCKVMLAVGK